MNIAQILHYKYPQAFAEFPGQIILAENEEGEIYIQSWNVPGVDQLTLAEILEMSNDPDVIKNKNRALNQPIYDKLLELDLKSIRAIRENNEALLAQYEAEASTLRSQLLPV